jgi:hypothetical protein
MRLTFGVAVVPKIMVVNFDDGVPYMSERELMQRLVAHQKKNIQQQGFANGHPLNY